jgi:7-cyano-7-deazaguanine synthase
MVVLLSGGIDSAAALLVARRTTRRVSAIHIDYGQPARAREWAAAQAIAGRYRVPIERLRLGIQLATSGAEIHGRNALLVLAAASRAGRRPSTIALGIHLGSGYYDSTPKFVEDTQRLLDGYFGGSVGLVAPFSAMQKGAVVATARRGRLPFALTYSCEVGGARACGLCTSCQDRNALGVDT